jgi:hypothetical protein
VVAAAPVVRAVRVAPVVRGALVVRVVPVVPVVRVVPAVVATVVVVPVAIAVRAVRVVPVAVATNNAWVPMGSRCRVSRVPRVRRWIVARVRRSRRSRVWAPMGSPCRPSRAATASRSAPMRVVMDPTESRGIPSVARSVRPSAPPSRRRLSSR